MVKELLKFIYKYVYSKVELFWMTRNSPQLRMNWDEVRKREGIKKEDLL